MIAKRWGVGDQQRPADAWLMQVVSWTWKIKMLIHVSGDLMLKLKERAEAEAIRVFSMNLKDLLLAAPAGAKATMGLDPGIRTGVKIAVVDKQVNILIKTLSILMLLRINGIRRLQL